MLFSKIYGLEETKDLLRKSVIQNRLSHALMFTGTEGIGKLPLAIAFAQYVNCENRTEKDACGVCPSCIKFSKLIHPDLHFVFPVIKQGAGKPVVSADYISEWREMVLEEPYFNLNQWTEKIGSENKQSGIFTDESKEIISKLNLKTFEAEYKIMIIWLPEKMHVSCANKLLKILEEPPPKTLFLLVSEATERILATILSRVQIMKIPKLKESVLTEVLQEKYQLDAQQAEDVARLSGGSLSHARQLVQASESQQYFFDMFVKVMRLAYGKKILELNGWVEEITTIGRERQKSMLNYMLRLVRENFILNLKEPTMNFLTTDERGFSEKFSPFVNERNVGELYDELGKAYYHIERNGNPKLVFFDLSIKLIQLLQK